MVQLFSRVEFTNPLETPLQKAIYAVLEANKFRGYVSAEQASQLKAEFNLNQEELYFAMLPFSARYAYPTVSQFYVGAIIEDLDGNFFFGGNQEFAGIGISYTVHAEQCAINHAFLSGARGVKSIIVNYSPCGHCRQFINELNTAKELKIYLPQIPQGAPLAHYLPDSFGPADLDVAERLFDNNRNVSVYDGKTVQEVVELIKQEEKISYSPYSNSNQFVVLTTKDNRHYVGRYIENAAFNPSFQAGISAICLARVYGESATDFTNLTLVENPNSPYTMAGFIQELSKAFAVEPAYQTMTNQSH